MKPVPENPSVVILAAGMSTRMGAPKPLLFFDNQNTFIEKIVETYKEFGAKEIIVVVNSTNESSLKKVLMPERTGVIVASNNKPEAERFLSLKIGLEKVTGKNCFVHNADNPFLNIGTLKQLNEMVKANHYVVPLYNGKKGHPALLSKEIIRAVCDEEIMETKINEFLKKFSIIKCPVDDWFVMANVDTMKDYLGYFPIDLWSKSVNFYKKIKS